MPVGFVALVGSALAQDPAPLFVPREDPAPAVDGPIRAHTLTNAESISGLVLPAGSRVWLHDDAPEVALRVVPATDVTWWGVTWAAGAEVRLDLGTADRPQRSGTLASSQRVGAFWLAGGSSLVFSCATAACPPAEASSVGAIRGATLDRPARVGHVRWPRSAELVLSAEGGVEQARLPVDSTLRLPTHPRTVADHVGAITFHPTGEVARLVLAKPVSLHQVRAAAGQPLAFGPDGAVAALTLGKPGVVAGHRLEARTSVSYAADGSVVLRSPVAQVVAGLPLGPETISLELDAAGQPRALVTEGDFTYRGVAISGSDRYRVLFWDDGALQVARLAEPVEAKGRVVPAGAYVRWHRDGTVEELDPATVEDR